MQHMVRAAWWALAVIALAFSIWFAVTGTMADVDLGCAKVAEGGAAFDCGDRVTDVLGIRPPVWLGISLVAPSAVAAAAGRVWTSSAATMALLAAGIVGLANWTGFWGTLLVALPLAALGAFVTFIQIARKRRPERHPERRRGQVRG